MTVQVNRHPSGDVELVLPYTKVDGVLACIFVTGLFGGPAVGGLLVQYFCVHELLIFAGLLDASEHVIADNSVATWSTGGWFVALSVLLAVGSIVTLSMGSIALRIAALSWRSVRGVWWLRLSSSGFEVNDRPFKRRRYAWREVDKFMLVNGVHVCFSFVPGRRRTLGNKFPTIFSGLRDHDGARAHGLIMGYWDRPFDEAVDLMNEWLMRYKAA